MFFFFLSLSLLLCGETNIELKSWGERETGKLLVFFFLFIKVNHVLCACVVVSRLVSDLAVHKTEGGEKMSAFSVWLAKNANKGRVPAKQSDL